VLVGTSCDFYIQELFLVCSKVLIVAAFKRRCCWSAPEVLFADVATSMLSGIRVPVCCSYFAFIVSQALKSCPNRLVCWTSIKASQFQRYACLVVSGRQAEPRPSFKTMSCFILANQKSVLKLAGRVKFFENILMAAASHGGGARVKCLRSLDSKSPSAPRRLRNLAGRWPRNYWSCKTNLPILRDNYWNVCGSGNWRLPKSPPSSAILLGSLKCPGHISVPLPSEISKVLK